MMLGLIVCFILFVILIFVATQRFTLSPLRAHILITGGSSGIGLAIAMQARKEGANVTIVARDQKKLDEAKAKIEEVAGAEDSWVNTVSLDITSDWAEVDERMKALVESHGPVQVLINCAGYSVAHYFEDGDQATFERLMQVNYLGAVAVTRALLPLMRQDDSLPEGIGSSICFVSSMAGQLGIFGFTGYSASKFALRGLAESLYFEVLEDNISITLAFPPDTDTPGFKNEQRGKPDETKAICEIGGLVSPENVARKIFRDTINRRFFSSYGFEGWLLSTMTTGMSPPDSFPQAVLRATCAFPLQMIGVGYRFWMRCIVRKSSTRAARLSALKAKKE